jgi:hypothetical protein
MTKQEKKNTLSDVRIISAQLYPAQIDRLETALDEIATAGGRANMSALIRFAIMQMPVDGFGKMPWSY